MEYKIGNVVDGSITFMEDTNKDMANGLQYDTNDNKRFDTHILSGNSLNNIPIRSKHTLDYTMDLDIKDITFYRFLIKNKYEI